MEGLESTDRKLCEIHHTVLVNGQCAVCNRDEDREDVVATASRGMRMLNADEAAPSPSGGRFRTMYEKVLRDTLGTSPLAETLLRRAKLARPRDEESLHKAAHVPKKPLR